LFQLAEGAALPHVVPRAIGLMFGAMGAGALCGALAAPAVQRRLPANVVLC
jgi:hypothetical protein